MGSGEKLIKVANYNTALNSVLGTDFASFAIYKSNPRIMRDIPMVILKW